MDHLNISGRSDSQLDWPAGQMASSRRRKQAISAVWNRHSAA